MNARIEANSMKRELKIDFEQLSLEELWCLRENIKVVLEAKIRREKSKLDRRLAQLEHAPVGAGNVRRPYPAVLPKYRNPANPGETWSGRGKRPVWVVAQLKSGKELDDLAIIAVGP